MEIISSLLSILLHFFYRTSLGILPWYADKSNMVKEATLTMLAIVRQNVYAVLAGGFLLVAIPSLIKLLEILKTAQGK